MNKTSILIKEHCMALRNDTEAIHLSKFFKTGKGEYGEGDKFLGLRVPTSRKIIKDYFPNATYDDALELMKSEWHEIRLCGFLLLIEFYRKSEKSENAEECRKLCELYLKNLDYCNNWDLVDLSTPYILGREAIKNNYGREMIQKLSVDNRLWHRRVGIVATLAMIRVGLLDDIYELAPKQFNNQHDLIQKATGWMLREAGKKDENRLKLFLRKNESYMPRTMWRYSIEIIKRTTPSNFLNE